MTNPHATAARMSKASKLVAVLAHIGATAAQVRAFTDQQWEQTALIAGTPPPKTSRAEAVRMLEEREAIVREVHR